MGEYLSQNFRLKDRRSQPEYDVWNNSVEPYLKRTDQEERTEEAVQMIQTAQKTQLSVR